MVLILKIVWNVMVDHFNSIGKDPRTNHLPLTQSYSQLLFIVGVYVLVVLKIGPMFMSKRKPYNIKSIIQVYNIFQILMNLYIYYGLTKHFVFSPNYSWTCMKYDKTDTSPDVLGLAKFIYLYYINKILDFLDTIFFVLRKKFNQISFLHVYHHAIMAWGGFIYMNRFFGSQFTVVGHVNSLVHVLMYTYYFLSALDIKLNMDSWKPYMTKIQIIQFFYFAIKFFVTIVRNGQCGLPYEWLGTLFIQNLFMTAMFSHFYWKNYIVKERQRKLKN
ncbi:elongation of very long chain fatty acids protein 7-like [Lucilia cuprina]|uniref:elongation of very long chain fatty acids protein 7-like n=1 Tax=Lucilia cuprina TaxID=7375 RepID=UPI001F0677DC|nr:elongation of very long chain fatty acids protein 7-like [Lucilia cuprina]